MRCWALPCSGVLNKDGKGSLNLLATNTYTGETLVKGGRLAVNGSIASSTQTTVFDGAVVGGTGTVGNLTIAAGGTLSPGNSMGALNVAGNLNLAKGSTYAVEVDESGSTDRVIVTGKTTIAGGTVMNIAANGNYKPRTDYSIISSAGGVEGNFETVTSNLIFLDPSLLYGAIDVKLRLERNDTAFDDVAGTFNQRSAARGADSLGFGNPLYDAVVLLDQQTAQSAFAQMGGEVHASTYSALIDNSRLVRDTALDRLRSASNAPSGRDMTLAHIGGNGVENSGALNIWTKAYGSWGETTGDGNAAGFSHSTGGVMAGADTLIGNSWQVGAFGGYGRTSVSIDDLASRSDSDNFDLGVYGGTFAGPFGIRFGATHSWFSIDSTRTLSLPTLSERLTSDYDASATQIFGEVSYQRLVGPAMIEPFANLAYLNFQNDVFSERGGASALTGESGNLDTVFTTLGLRGEADFTVKETKGSLFGSVSWQHAAGDLVPESAMSFTGGSSFTVRGAPAAKDIAVVNAGLNFNVSPSATLGVSYTGQFGSGASNNGINGNFDIRF